MKIKDFFNKNKINEINEVDLQSFELNTEHEYSKYKYTEKSSITNVKKKEIKNLNAGHRSRVKNKILSSNIESMQDYELIEALLMYCLPRVDVKPIAKNIVNNFSNIKEMLVADMASYKNIEGLGDSSFVFFKIINELFCRSFKEDIVNEVLLNSPEKVMIYCNARMSGLKYEQFRVLFLNRKNKLIKDEVIQNGTIDRASIFPKELIKKAIDCNAGAMILAHNHPSGDPTPSKADIEITCEIKKAAKLMDIFVYDHIIVGKNENISLKSSNLM